MILMEAPWFSVAPLKLPTSTGRIVEVDRLDMRLEDLRKYGGVKIIDVYNWVAKLPALGGPPRFLTHDHGVVNTERAQELTINWGARGWRLPDDWYDYVLGMNGDDVVKTPKHPRPDAGELTQAELDVEFNNRTTAESFERRLARILC